ncbi:hypothetical protein AYO36_13480 [Exiguobacterium sp. KKBO11]|uniref:hypothetical protein n=1 Tax=Exiguobacterium sp. KKBO11 TaxID=1805000 RepID=UPI0007D7FFFC|nr:hypothetical protein [Exiguobacterium sp. KKBO11]OAI84169.1 hypothetical protein AYO36_13480 [Exiguobacterium sp. KKBO11]
MKKQYLIQVRDKNNLTYLNEFGSIVYIARLKGLVIFETSQNRADELSKHPQILSIKLSREFKLA